MWRIRRSLQAFLTAILLGCLLVVHLAPIRAGAADTPSLTISQLKINSSNGQFITLYNATDRALDMSRYQLEYFNHYDLGKATSSRLIALSGIVPPHGYYMVNDGALLLCYRLTVDSVSLGFSSTAGFIEVLALDQPAPGGPIGPVLQDYVGWSKTSAPGAQVLPAGTEAFLQRQSTHTAVAIPAPGAGSWLSVQPDPADPCGLVGSAGNLIETGLSQLLPPGEPPAIMAEEASATGTTGAVMPAANIGLMVPTITELLPNPAGTGTDSSDEFIELYNPNTRSFDLAGFSLQSGTTTPRAFTFPAGSSLAPQAFTAFYAKTTGLSLSNGGGQVKLLDPSGNSIAASEPYATAADGQSWALARGKWYWTLTVTPGKANTIKQPPPKKSSAKVAASKSKTAKTASGKAVTAKGSPAGADSADEPATNPIHTRTLALVAGTALLYGTYEYRADLADRIYRVRRYFGGRHADRA